MKTVIKSQCPCGSGKKYCDCCQRYHNGQLLPENALVLMKSRYSAYTLGIVDYIIETTHKSNPSYRKDLSSWKKEILEFSKNNVFKNLEIVDFEDGQEEAFVTFIAHLGTFSFKEKSHFKKVDNKWLYFNGQLFKK